MGCFIWMKNITWKFIFGVIPLGENYFSWVLHWVTPFILSRGLELFWRSFPWLINSYELCIPFHSLTFPLFILLFFCSILQAIKWSVVWKFNLRSIQKATNWVGGHQVASKLRLRLNLSSSISLFYIQILLFPIMFFLEF